MCIIKEKALTHQYEKKRYIRSKKEASMNEKLSRNESQHNNKNKLLSTEREKLVPLHKLNFALFSLFYTTVI
jgi:hypothetical protein